MVKIDDKYYIDADSNCYILREKYIVQDEKSKKLGEEVFRDKGYYTTVESCLEGYLKQVTRKYIRENGTDLKALLEEVKKQNKFVKSLDVNV